MRALALSALAGMIIGTAAVPPLGEPSAELTRLFTPIALPSGTYLVFRSDRPAAEIAAALRATDDEIYPGEWDEERPEGMAAFEAVGTADRARLARLFTGSRVTMFRGTIRAAIEFVAYTVISPYPDPSLSRLEPGTVVIRFEVPAPAPPSPNPDP